MTKWYGTINAAVWSSACKLNLIWWIVIKFCYAWINDICDLCRNNSPRNFYRTDYLEILLGNMLYAIDQVFLEIFEDYFANLFIFFLKWGAPPDGRRFNTFPSGFPTKWPSWRRSSLYSTPLWIFFCAVGSMRCDEIIRSDSIMWQIPAIWWAESVTLFILTMWLFHIS